MPVTRTLKQLAELTGAQLQGPSDLVISQVGSLETAGAGCLSFLADKHHRARLEKTQAAAVVVPTGVECQRPHLISQHPYLDFIKIIHQFAPAPSFPPVGIDPTAVVHPTAVVAADAAIGPLCVIQAGAKIGPRSVLVAQVFIGEGTELGEDAILYPQVILRERLHIGRRVTIHSGAVVGADGFGFVSQEDAYIKVPQIGTVVIEDDVEVGANTTIDRAALGETRIGQGTKLDNLVMIAHNVVLGDHTAIAAQTGVSGSTHVGHHVIMGGQVGTVGHIEIGDRAVLGAQAGVTRSVSPGIFVSGYPARPHQEAMRQLGELSRLVELRRRVTELEKRLEHLEHP